MILNVYSIYDVSVKAFMQPFFSQSNASATRSFSMAVNDPGTVMAKHPEDFFLFHVGWFDDEKGSLEKMTPGPAKLVGAFAVNRKLQLEESATMADEVRQPLKGDGDAKHA